MNTVTDRPPSFWRSWGSVWGLGFLAMLPLLALYLVFIWRFEHYRYYPFALLLSGYLVWERWDRRVVAPSGILAWAVVVVSLLLLVVGGLLYSPWLGAVAFVLWSGVCLLSHRSRTGERLVLAWLPLLMLLRLPLGYDQRIVVALQNLTTRVSSYLLDIFAVSHKTLGNVIQLPDRELLVAEACSGIQSAFTLCFVAVAIVAWKRRPLVIVPLALAFALLWALAANVVRVTSIALAATIDVDLSTGWAHEALGYAVLVAAAGLVLSTDHFLRIGWHPMAAADGMEEENPLVRAWDWMMGGSSLADANESAPSPEAGTAESPEASDGHPAAATSSPRKRFGKSIKWSFAGGAVVAIGLMANLPLLLRGAIGNVATQAGSKELFFEPEAGLLESVAEEMEVTDHRAVRDGDDPRLGTHADLWTIKHPLFRGELILSQPYKCWHDLSICYKNLDWIQMSRYSSRVGKAGEHTKGIAVDTFQSRDGLQGYLIYSAFRESGSVVEPPAEGLIASALQRSRDLIEGAETPLDEYQNHAMLQLWIVTNGELPDSALTEAIETFGSIRERFAQAIRQSRDG